MSDEIAVPSVYVGLAMAADRWPIEPDCVEILQAGHAVTLTSREARVVAKRLVWLADLLGPDPEGEGLMREFPAAAQPPLLPPLTAVQRAWVVASVDPLAKPLRRRPRVAEGWEPWS